MPPTRIGLVIILLVCAATASSSSGRGQAADAAAFPRAARRAIAHGKASEAESLARARPANDPAAAAVLGLLAAKRGKYDEAVRVLEPAANADPAGDAALELGLLHQYLGRHEAAGRLLLGVYRRASSDADGDALLRAGRAAAALGRVDDAKVLLNGASRLGPDPGVETAWGELLLEKYNRTEALRSFQQALKLDPEWAPAHVGLGRTLAEEDPPAAEGAANRALEIDPMLADAHLLLADLDVDNTKYDTARERIGRVLTVNPSHLEALSLLAGIAYVRDGRPAFDVEARKVLAINPGYGDVYRVAGDLSARSYRFEDAVTLTREAVALDPTNARAFADLGMHLMRTGDEPEARRSLERAFKTDSYDRVTFNLLSLLDTLEKYDVVRDGDLVFKFHPQESAVLREYAIPLAHEALQKLSAKYQFTPKGPILIEVFQQHDDFAVRNLGLPGLIGALGACFGRVVSMDSPHAREPPGSFSWQETLWHELAHVVTLQMSSQRVPRWLTEGISVYEEGRARPEWGRDMDLPFAMALQRGKTLKLRDLNSGFTRPDTIALAYYQSSLLVDHIVTSKGEAALRALLLAYGQGLEGEPAITKALGVGFDQLQASFDQALAQRYSGILAAIRDHKEAPGGDVDALRAAASAQQGSYQAQLAYGVALAKAGDKGAFAPLERAAALVPTAIGPESPHALMGALAEQLGDSARAITEYQALLAVDHTALEPARRLAALAEKAKDEQTFALAQGRVVALDPFDPQGHSGLGKVAMRHKDAAVAMREFKAALALGPPDKASAHCDLGESYLLAGRAADAKREALAALEIAPSFERAQDLLLKAIEGKGSEGGR
jgi:tetratricopeptide (TPR) repeat protein